MGNILIIDDDQSLCYSLSRVLGDAHAIQVSHNSNDAFEIIASSEIHLVLLDYKLGGEDGLTVLTAIKKRSRDLPVILMTAYGSNEVVMESIKLGAEDYLMKPIHPEELESVIAKYALPALVNRISDYYELEPSDRTENQFIGYSKPISSILRTVAQVAKTEAPVLITGESGTGKELIARMIHDHSNRRNHPFVALNCAAIPENLLESELFGYVRGAFSGAYKTKIGKLEHADKGTLLLDEIGDTPMPFQTKLLRFLQEKTVEKLGENRSEKVDVRIISATNKNIPDLIEKKLFRQDLFYRMNAVHLQLPALRERKKDLKALLDYFVQFYTASTQNKIRWIEKSVVPYLETYHWPGNIRELQNVIRSAVIQSTAGCLKKENIEILTLVSDRPAPQFDGDLYGFFANKFKDNIFENSVAFLEKELIAHVLSKNKHRLSRSAEELNISRVTLNAKIKKYHIEKHAE